MQYAVKDIGGRIKLLVRYRDVSGFVCRDDDWTVQLHLCGGQTLHLTHDAEKGRDETIRCIIDGIQNDDLSAP